jgi:hypothetical protein
MKKKKAQEEEKESEQKELSFEELMALNKAKQEKQNKRRLEDNEKVKRNFNLRKKDKDK